MNPGLARRAAARTGAATSRPGARRCRACTAVAIGAAALWAAVAAAVLWVSGAHGAGSTPAAGAAAARPGVTINLPPGATLPPAPQLPQLPQVPVLPQLPAPQITINLGGAPAAASAPAATPAARGAATAPAAAPVSAPVPRPAPAPAPVAPTPTVSSPGPNPVAAAPATAPGLLEFAAADLPAARVGQRYGPLPLVRGQGVLVFDVEGDLAASGLELTQAGVLRGQATQPGRYRFTLTLVGAPGVTAPLRQTFTLRVLPARAAAPPARAASAAARTEPLTVPPQVLQDMQALEPGLRGHAWKLATPDLETLAAQAVKDAARREAEQVRASGFEPVPGAPPSDEAQEAGQLLQARLLALLPAVVDVEFPAQGLFESALAAQARAACLKVATRAAALAGRTLDPTVCDAPPAAPAPRPTVAKTGRPAAGAPAAATAPPAGATAVASATTPATAPGPATSAPVAPLTPLQAQAELLPQPLLTAMGRLAAKPHAPDTAQPVRWNGGGCGCTLPRADYFSYGMLPFWLPQKDQPMTVDFSAYRRIGYIGALLGDDGSLVRAQPWNDEHADGLRRALDHGVGLDLVVYRRGWGQLLAQTPAQRQALVQRAAQEIAAMVETPLQSWWVPLRRAALPFWPLPTHLYSGATLFLDEMPPGEDAQRLLAQLLDELVPRLERSARPLALNVVVHADALMAAPRDGTLATMLRLLERTGSIAPAGQAGLGSGGALAIEPLIRTRLLVLMPEPTTQSKKALRAALDRQPLLQSHQRVGFLNSLVPMMSHPAGEKAAPMDSAVALQFDADLAYYGWQYAGAGLWPLAAAERGAGVQAVKLMHANFRANEPWWRTRWDLTHQACAWVCPYRTEWRLGLNTLLLLGALSLALYAGSCELRQRLGRGFVLWMWGGLVVTGLVFWALLTCDPALDGLAEGNKPLLALSGAVLLAALWFITHRPAPKP